MDLDHHPGLHWIIVLLFHSLHISLFLYILMPLNSELSVYD